MSLVVNPAFKTAADFADVAKIFLQKIFLESDSLGIHFPPHWDIDHICYRSPSIERYQILKKEMHAFAELLTESMVNGRPISTFRLNAPLLFGDHEIDLLELPAPRADKIFQEGFEHIEMVVDISFQKLASEFFPPGVSELLNRSDEAKIFNKEMKLHLKTGTIKFHQLSLDSVIRLEKNSQAQTALRSSRVLEKLYKFEPVVAGVFPLGLDVKTSDFDVLVGATSLEDLEKTLQLEFSGQDLFSLKRNLVNDDQTVLCAFLADHFSFEILGQLKPSVEQESYKYFQLEERLLKLGGGSFRNKVSTLRQRDSLQTEAAFSAALGLKKGSHELLNLQGASNSVLREYLRATSSL